MSDRTNSRDEILVPIKLGDILMMMEACNYFAVRAMLCGRPQAQARMDHYRALFDAHVPPGARLFSGDVWSQMAIALNEADGYGLYVIDTYGRTERYFNPLVGRLVIHIGDKLFLSDDNIQDDAPEIADVEAVLAELAPMDCVRKELSELPEGKRVR